MAHFPDNIDLDPATTRAISIDPRRPQPSIGVVHDIARNAPLESVVVDPGGVLLADFHQDAHDNAALLYRTLAENQQARLICLWTVKILPSDEILTRLMARHLPYLQNVTLDECRRAIQSGILVTEKGELSFRCSPRRLESLIKAVAFSARIHQLQLQVTHDTPMVVAAHVLARTRGVMITKIVLVAHCTTVDVTPFLANLAFDSSTDLVVEGGCVMGHIDYYNSELPSNETLQRLTLDGCRVGNRTADVFDRFRGLQALTMMRCKPLEGETLHVNRLVANSRLSLSHLCLWRNRGGLSRPDWLNALPRLVKDMPNLKDLNLKGVDLNDTFLLGLADALSRGPRRVCLTITVSEGAAGSPQPAAAFLQRLHLMDGLRRLTINPNRINQALALTLLNSFSMIRWSLPIIDDLFVEGADSEWLRVSIRDIEEQRLETNMQQLLNARRRNFILSRLRQWLPRPHPRPWHVASTTAGVATRSMSARSGDASTVLTESNEPATQEVALTENGNTSIMAQWLLVRNALAAPGTDTASTASISSWTTDGQSSDSSDAIRGLSSTMLETVYEHEHALEQVATAPELENSSLMAQSLRDALQRTGVELPLIAREADDNANQN